MSHWASKYIGLPFEPGANGPEAVDCWGLVRLIYGQEFHITLRERPLATEAARDWQELAEPGEGCLVAMGRAGAGAGVVLHVGIYTRADRGLVIHAQKGQDVSAEALASLRRKGTRFLKFYKHRLWPGSS